mmetsp:Transcript_4080/g.12026  ORF Transcript_4080/g.12026 Transcript_4080/m.12026 type:complete len:451 (+) Transcript_4080:152-1504(+)
MATCDGMLMKKGGSGTSNSSPLKVKRRNWTRRWCRLEGGVLSYYKVAEGQTKLSKAATPRGTLKVAGGGVMDAELEGHKYAFAVHAGGDQRTTMWFRAPSAREKATWLAALRAAAAPGGGRPTSTEEDLRRCCNLLTKKNEALERELSRASGEGDFAEAKSADEDSISSAGSVPKVSDAKASLASLQYAYDDGPRFSDGLSTSSWLAAEQVVSPDSAPKPAFSPEKPKEPLVDLRDSEFDVTSIRANSPTPPPAAKTPALAPETAKPDKPLVELRESEFDVKPRDTSVTPPPERLPAFSPEKPADAPTVDLHGDDFQIPADPVPADPAKLPAFSPDKPKDAPTVDLHDDDFNIGRRTPTPPPPTRLPAAAAANAERLAAEASKASPVVELDDDEFFVPPKPLSAPPKKKGFLARLSLSPSSKKKEKKTAPPPPEKPATIASKSSEGEFDF